MATGPRIEARAFIEKLRKKRGGIVQADVEFLRTTRPHILEQIFALREELGASTRIVAEQLYHKKTRFVYELIQNAEDNQYSIAEQPSLCFTLRQDCIIIDSNEDGFTKKNIRAICSVGKSTKAYIQGYIGEKGIGFKSVFTVACKVHVQSEPYSFAFVYQREDPNENGLGMVTPFYEDHIQVPDGVQTRMILYLREDCDRVQLQHDFRALPDTLLLFLKKLKKLSVNIELPDHSEDHISYTLMSDDTGRTRNRVWIEKKVGSSASDLDFWITRRQVLDMPADNARLHIHEAEVVLAFPIDVNEVPVLEDQHVYAFLPLQRVGFQVSGNLAHATSANPADQFLIQSDFITQASREDILDCQWNRKLLREVRRTFVHAIDGPSGFLRHPRLKYTWVRYIPTNVDFHDLWGPFHTGLYEALRLQKAFFSRGDESRLFYARQLKVVTDRYRDQYMEPLLPDLDAGETAYVSEEYHHELDLQALRELGTENLSMDDFLRRLKQDLDDDDAAQLRSKPLDDDWHTRLSDLLIEALEDPARRSIIQRLNIIPLQSGSWARPLNASIFFPTSGAVDIPEDLPISLVRGETLHNQRRKTLFCRLGVAQCAPTRIFPLIEARYRAQSVYPIRTCIQDIKFLFFHNDTLPSNHSIYLAVTTSGGKRCMTSVDNGGWIYCPESDNPCSMYNLLSGLVPNELENHVRFPHLDYYATLRDCGLRNGIAGHDWLRLRSGVKVVPQLYRRDGSCHEPRMSAELLYIADRLSHHLLKVLEGNWDQYHRSAEWDTRMKNVKVPILNCTELRPLEMTYLPLPKLKDKVEELGLVYSFGFLAELDGMSDIEAVEWCFLEHFGVGVEDNVSFWLALLKQARQTDNVRKRSVFKIYSRLQTFNQEEDIEKMRERFEDDLIYIPSYASSTEWTWTSLKHCLWDGPGWFTYYACLQSVQDYQSLYGLLVNTLSLRNATVEDFLDYLEHIKISVIYLDQDEEAKIPLIYERLNYLAQDSAAGAIRDRISSRVSEAALVYCPRSRSWRLPSACVWAEDQIRLPGKLSIATLYREHRHFFQSILGVRKPSLEMHIRALIQKASDEPDKESILEEIGNICALDPPGNMLSSNLSDCACLPVKLPSGQIEWSSCQATFAVVDRRDYEDLFRNKIMTLDFSREEVHSIEPFLVGLGLEGRFMSRAVIEETRVQGGILHHELTNSLRRKAYAICRYAVHFGAADALTIYSSLQRTEVHVSDDISKTVSITQGNRTVAVAGDVAYFHICQEGDQMRLYVPRSAKHRQVCMARQLPASLLKHLGIQRPDQGAKLGAVITAASLFVVDEILQQDGIIEVAGVTRPEDDAEDDAEDSIIALSQLGPVGIEVAPSGSSTPNYERHTEYLSERLHRPMGVTSGEDPFWTPATSLHIGSPAPPERPELYKGLLDIVIQQAANIDWGFPAVGTSLVAPIVTDYDTDPNLAVRSTLPGEEHFKIGAAGELFMYEVLKRLQLRNFDTSCWQSTIRHRVAIHSRYSDLTRWNGSETADIVYQDVDNILTDLLIQLGYLRRAAWSDRQPRYYIEVKTTMGALESAFFCSQPQVDRMEQMQLPENGHSSEVYMIARVFGLGGSRMGFRLYFDPATLRRRQELTFVADRYTVTPS